MLLAWVYNDFILSLYNTAGICVTATRNPQCFGVRLVQKRVPQGTQPSSYEDTVFTTRKKKVARRIQ